ncbi:MAG: DEAD/DEAH box helicase [Candidatus Nanoarchaeia archaeon]|nr:DEAD/DEAH box helicase [Candidatus Nanoarchaeia archaeon]MDD5239294.1 DEAD/DEAH box helicase [Candidatus Nanoarchaeia archaeon]
MVFKTLNPKIEKWLLKKGYVEASLAQKLAIPQILEKKNTLVFAPTGHGKTLAAVLPIFSELLKDPEAPGIRMLYVTPLKSLNRDLFDKMVNLAEEVGLSVDLRHGDTPQKIRQQQVQDPADVLITTPETLQSLLSGKNIVELLKNIEYVVIDEIHELCENKRGSQLSIALERIQRLCKKEFQRIGLSATIGDPQMISKYLSGGRECSIVDARTEKKYDIQIEHPKPDSTDKELAKKLKVTPNGAFCLRRIKELVEKSDSTLIFVNTRETAESLGARFRNWAPEFPVAVHHSSLSKEVRIDVEQKFKDGRIKAIIATSSLELGIDIGSIDLVIQYGSPRQVTKLMQRIGRSGHGLGRTSKGVLLCTSIDDYLEASAILEKSKNWLEEPKMPEKPFDVLSHQVVGICMDYNIERKSATKKEMLELVKKAYPYRNLSEDEFESLISVMRDIYLIGEENGKYFRTRKGLLYYYANLSMIPNEKNYDVISAEINKKIGVLHQGFVSQHIKRGVDFIMKGEPWRVTEYDDEKIFVVQSKNSESAIPSWEGELIPVPKEIANLAGDMREKFDFDDLKTQKERFVVPTSKRFYMESYQLYTIIHSCFGSKINETLGKALGVILSAKTGITVGTRSDAYRIILKMPDYGQEQVLEALQELEPEWLESILRKSLRNSSMFEFRFFQIAKRFGVIGRDAMYSGTTLSKMVEVYANTPLFEETINELFREKLDVKGTIELLKLLRSGKIKLETSAGYEISPLGIEGLDYTSISLVKPKEKIKEIYELVHERLLKRKFWFACMKCGDILGVFAVSNIPEDLKCKCKARIIGFIPEKEKDLARKVLNKHFKKEKLDDAEKELFRKFSESAELFLNYGKKACYVLAGYGVGPTVGKRILGKIHKTDDELLRDIVDAERNFASTKMFWR